jgi:outer membrane receptor protein involved in Fe transport
LSSVFEVPNSSFAPAPAGGPLPGTPKNSLAVGLEYGHVAFAGGDWRYAVNAHYQSVVLPSLSATVPTVPGFTMVNTRLSYARSHLTGTLYVNNVTNNLGITSIQDPALFGNRAQSIISQPRTVGITLAYRFKER